MAAARFDFLPGTSAYDVRSEATIEMVAGPERERGREVVRSSARVSYALTAVGAGAARNVAIAGEVDGYAVEGSARVGAGPNEPAAAAVRFRGTVDGRRARVDVDGAVAGCATAAGATQLAALGAARETVLPVPASLSAGARWRDSVVVITCRSQLPGTLTVVSRYEVAGIAGSQVRVRRQTTTTLRGGGIVAGRTVTLSGSGSGETTMELDAARGRLVRSDGETRSTITVTLPDGARQFTQQVRTEVRGRDGT